MECASFGRACVRVDCEPGRDESAYSTPVLPGAAFIPDIARSDIKRISKAAFGKAGISDADRFALKRFRRGLSNALL